MSVGTGNKSILAVVVLYKMEAGASPAFTSLRDLLTASPQATESIDLIVCDNTPYEQQRPKDFDGLYVPDTSNPGLAKPYNLALKIAAERKCSWLLLLDQDTTLTAEYVTELLAGTSAELQNSEIVAVVPKLSNLGSVASPHFPRNVGPARGVAEDFTGISSGKLCVFNSGAALRVAALEAVGGFPLEYPLDHLDHATFSKLQQRGGKIYVLQSILIHDLSVNDTGKHDPRLVARQVSITDSEHRYYKEFGSPLERWMLRFRLMRSVLGRIYRRKDRRQTWRLFKAFFRV